MKIIYNNIIPFPGYKCINLFGVLFVRKRANMNNFDFNHEKIHTAQMKELWYIGFYLLYITEFIIGLLHYWNWKKAYRNISFEKEAYDNEEHLSYLTLREPYAWKEYRKN